jgi:hypothetical protein
VIGQTSGPREVSIEQRVVRLGYVASDGHVVFPDTELGEYDIEIQGENYTVYRLNQTDEYIDVSSCRSVRATG